MRATISSSSFHMVATVRKKQKMKMEACLTFAPIGENISPKEGLNTIWERLQAITDHVPSLGNGTNFKHNFVSLANQV